MEGVGGKLVYRDFIKVKKLVGQVVSNHPPTGLWRSSITWRRVVRTIRRVWKWKADGFTNIAITHTGEGGRRGDFGLNDLEPRKTKRSGEGSKRGVNEAGANGDHRVPLKKHQWRWLMIEKIEVEERKNKPALRRRGRWPLADVLARTPKLMEAWEKWQGTSQLTNTVKLTNRN